MIEFIHIRNYAIIDDLRVEYGDGFNTLTGETGAGKSILLGALKLVLGARASADSIRTGTERAMVEALFNIGGGDAEAWLDRAGFRDDDSPGQVSLRREIAAGGGSRSFVNGQVATLAQLRELGELLVDMHGQNEHTSLYTAAAQLQLLDGFGAHDAELATYREAYRAFRAAASVLAELTDNRTDAERRKAFLEFQVDEIDKAAPAVGEDAALDTEHRRLQNAERLRLCCSAACDLLYEGERTDNPASGLIAAAAKSLAEAADMDPSCEALARDAESLRFAAEDLAARARQYIDAIAADPERLAAVDDRLEVLRSLKRKYGATIEEVLATREQLARDLAAIEHHEEALAAAQERLEHTRAAALDAAASLSARRRTAAEAFQKHVEKQMRELELPKAVFRLDLACGLGASPDASALDATGADRVEFLVALNPGEEKRPLRKVASGGEVARIMLAIKSVLAGRDRTPTLVFDEIDVGISGEAAARVADKLADLSHSHQVICITHLPQIAARGDRHMAVEKSVERSRTKVTVRVLDGEERTAALARMLSGREIDETSRRYARKLLSKGS